MLGESRVRLVAVAVGVGVIVVLAAHVVGRVYEDPTIWALAGWSVTPDFSVFYGSAHEVLAGRTPYQDHSFPYGLGYVYPPLLAFLLSPLSILPFSVATALWALLSMFFVVGALYLLGVRDWRCYPVALLWPFNREALEFGAIDPLLLLVVAACWRYRDHPWRESASAGCAIALKLFLWPLVLWLAFTGRIRTAGLAVVSACVLIFVPWALIGFQGLVQYPSLLHIASEQKDRTYSLVALAHSLGFSGTLGYAISLACGLALLALAFLATRDVASAAGVRDRRSLALLIAASLVLTPIVWTHYFVLLLVPVALARPRLSFVWILPLLGSVLYAFAWYRPSPEGDLLPLIAVLTVASLVFAVCLWPRELGAVVTWARERTWARAAGGGMVRLGRRRVMTSVAAAVFVLAMLFAVLPEMLGDRPYDPRPSTWPALRNIELR